MKVLLVRASTADEPPVANEQITTVWPEAEIEAASSGPELERALAHQWFDVILTGYALEWSDGLVALRTIRGCQPNTPVIVITRAGSEEIAVEALQAGAQDYLTPATLERLPQAVQRCLEAARLRRDHPPAIPLPDSDAEKIILTLKPLLDTPSDLVLLVDTDGTLVYANDTFLRRAGSTPETIAGSQLADVLPPEVAERRLEVIREVARSGKTVRFEDKGVVGWYDITIYPILDAGGGVSRIAVVARDITEKKHVEEALQNSYNTIQALVDAPASIVIVIDRQGRILVISKNLAAQLGYTSQELVGRSIRDVVSTSELYTRGEGYRQVLETKQPVRFETLWGQAVFDVVIFPILGESGEIEQLAYIARDITQTKVVEAALRQSEIQLQTTVQELQVSRNELAAVLDHMADGVAVLDAQGKLTFANEAIARILGYASVQAYAADFETLSAIELMDEHGRPLDRSQLPGKRLAAGQSDGPSVIRFRRRGETQEHWVVFLSTPVYARDGDLQQIVTIIQDITELKLTQQALEEAGSELACRVEERTTELAQANRDLVRAVAQAEALTHMASRLNAPTELGEVAQAMCAEALKVSGYPSACVLLMMEDSDNLQPAAASGAYSQQLLTLSPITIEQYEDYFQEGRPAFVYPDAMANPGMSATAFVQESGLRTIIIFRLVNAGVHLGVLAVLSYQEVRLPSEDELKLLQSLADFGATAIARSWLYYQVVDSRSRLETLSRKLVEIQDLERRKIAVELHDQVGQMLTSLKMILERIGRSLQSSPIPRGSPVVQDIETAGQQVQTVLEQVRQLSLELRPPMLDEMGLLPALLTYVDKFCERSGARVDFRHSGLYGRLDGAIEKALYRMVQEGLTNVVRHSGVKEASVLILLDENRLVAQVRDQGRGFDADITLHERPSTGLSGMAERIALCGGELTIESEPGKGTCLTAEYILEADNLNPAEPSKKRGPTTHAIRDKDETGYSVQAAAPARDISERRQAREELRRARAELEQRVVERTAELEAANHELRIEVVRRLEAENAWRRTAARTEALARVAASANVQPEVDRVLQTICDESVQVLPFSIASVGLYDESRDAFVPRANAAPNTQAIVEADLMPRSHYEKLLDDFGSPIIITDVPNTPPFDRMKLLAELDVRTLISLPLYDRNELIGYLVLASPGKTQTPTAEMLEFLKTLVQTIEIAISNARLLKELGDSQDRLRAFSNHQVEVQETHRRRLARELNDDIGQRLTLLNLNLEQAERAAANRSGGGSEVLVHLSAGHEQVERLLSQIRDLSLDLRPGVLDDLGLLAALLDYFERFTRRSGMQVNFKQSGLDRRFSPQIETAAFRIIQEALTNAARYSGVSEVEVLMWVSAQNLGVKIQDAGVGFDVHHVHQARVYHGLDEISERAAACGGRLEIESSAGQGATLTLEIPIQPPEPGTGELP